MLLAAPHHLLGRRGAPEPSPRPSSDHVLACSLPGKSCAPVARIHQWVLSDAGVSTGRRRPPCASGMGAGGGKGAALGCSSVGAPAWLTRFLTPVGRGRHPGQLRSSRASPGRPEPGWRARGRGPGSGPPSLGVSGRQEASTFIAASFSKSLPPQCVSGTSSESTQLWLCPGGLSSAVRALMPRRCRLEAGWRCRGPPRLSRLSRMTFWPLFLEGDFFFPVL